MSGIMLPEAVSSYLKLDGEIIRQEQETAMKRQTTSPDSRKTNPVAKNAHLFNQGKVFTDRKKAAKRGYVKHKQPGNG